MTTGKRSAATIVFFFLFICICFALASCTKTDPYDEGVLDKLSSVKDTEDSSDEEPEEIIPAASLFRVVVPENASPALVSKANELALAISEATSIDARTIYDHEKVTELEGAVEILLGKTSRTQSLQGLKGLRINDYVCEWYAGSLVLGGISSEATVAAIDRFCREIIPTSTVAVLMSEEQAFGYTGEYDISSAKLNGFVLFEYSIIYSSANKLGELAIAESLRDRILEESGYLLDVIPDTAYSGGKYISVGRDIENIFGITLKEDSALLACKKDRVLIVSDSGKGLLDASEYFVNMLFDTDAGGEASLWLDEGTDKTFEYSTPEFLFSVFFDSTPDTITIPKINSFTSLLGGAEFFFALSGAIGDDIYSRTMFGLSGKEQVSVSVGGGRVLPLIYDSSRVSPIGETKVEYLYDCTVSYTEFRLAGEELSLLVFNAFCGEKGKTEWASAKIEEIAEERGLPFVAIITDDTGGLSAPAFANAQCVGRYSYGDSYFLFVSEELSVQKLDGKQSSGIVLDSFFAEVGVK